MKPETVEAYRVVKIDGCAHCKQGDAWEVIDRDDCGTGTTFGDEVDAEELAALLNHVFNEGFRARDTTPEYQALVKDAERIDKMQEVFVKGQETHILMCEGHAMDECDHPTHPHFEAFDWNWRCPPVRGMTLREVMDAAIDAARNG